MVYVLFSDRIWQKAIFKGWGRLMILWQPLENEMKLVQNPSYSIKKNVCICAHVYAYIYPHNKHQVKKYHPLVIIFYLKHHSHWKCTKQALWIQNAKMHTIKHAKGNKSRTWSETGKKNSREKILNNDRMAERTKKNKTNPKTYEQKRLLSHSLNF